MISIFLFRTKFTVLKTKFYASCSKPYSLPGSVPLFDFHPSTESICEQSRVGSHQSINQNRQYNQIHCLVQAIEESRNFYKKSNHHKNKLPVYEQSFNLFSFLVLEKQMSLKSIIFFRNIVVGSD